MSAQKTKKRILTKSQSITCNKKSKKNDVSKKDDSDIDVSKIALDAYAEDVCGFCHDDIVSPNDAAFFFTKRSRLMHKTCFAYIKKEVDAVKNTFKPHVSWSNTRHINECLSSVIEKIENRNGGSCYGFLGYNGMKALRSEFILCFMEVFMNLIDPVCYEIYCECFETKNFATYIRDKFEK